MDTITVNVVELHDFINEIIDPSAVLAFEKCYRSIFGNRYFKSWHDLFPQIDRYILPTDLKAKFFLDYPKKYYFTYLKFINPKHHGFKQVYIDNIYTFDATLSFFEETYISPSLVLPAITMRFGSDYEVYITINLKSINCVNVSVNKGYVKNVRHTAIVVKKRYLKYTTKSRCIDNQELK